MCYLSIGLHLVLITLLMSRLFVITLNTKLFIRMIVHLLVRFWTWKECLKVHPQHSISARLSDYVYVDVVSSYFLLSETKVKFERAEYPWPGNVLFIALIGEFWRNLNFYCRETLSETSTHVDCCNTQNDHPSPASVRRNEFSIFLLIHFHPGLSFVRALVKPQISRWVHLRERQTDGEKSTT